MNAPEWISVGAAVSSAVFAALGIGVSIYISKSAENDRRLWEADQDTKRNSWSKDLQRDQQEWEKSWRAELDARERAMRAPVLSIEIGYGVGVYSFAPQGQQVISITAKNVGIADVHIKNWGQILLPNNMVMEPPLQNPASYRIEDNRNPVMPGDSVSVSWSKEFVINQLKKNNYTGTIVLRGAFTDRLGNRHISDALAPALKVDSAD